MADSRNLIRARNGVLVHLSRGTQIRVVNTYGQQVIDTWAFNRGDASEYMSMEHSRVALNRLIPKVGDALYTNRRRAILTVVEDTSGGIHDMLIAACDVARYRSLGHIGHHDSCAENLTNLMAKFSLPLSHVPCPLNLFMNIPWTQKGDLSFEPSLAAPGGYITLRAEVDCAVVLSACPQDVVPINGIMCTPRDAHYEIILDERQRAV